MTTLGATNTAKRIYVKICGLTRQHDASVAVEAGADALGFNFWPLSKRFLPPEKADWLRDLPDTVCRVGVFVNASEDWIEHLWSSGLIHAIQLHGDEPDSAIVRWQTLGAPVIRAAWLREVAQTLDLRNHPADSVLFDTFKLGGYGGHGQTFPWALARAAREAAPKKNLLLAGGLHPDNVTDAILQTGIAAVDVAGGVESAPGVKDEARLRDFIKNAKESMGISDMHTLL